MRRPVRLASVAEDDIHIQLNDAAASLFWRFDLPAAMTGLSRPGTWEYDDLDPRPDAVVIYALDIWPEGFPDRPES